ncbi:response regulator [Cyclobacterium jeungdonense]|uniref:Response regulator n=1 Tax=Cyclobacterium jeungdonense TaxID=708087 RepID=A0ABT8C6R9_9BACT|nr:response regulator [Cyclobacterium jeungdonense]MDN3688493.1 response regulator [Cyclobacterium jeungdonense]
MVDIVLVDDDKVSTYVTEKFIRKSLNVPYRIHTFNCATEALNKIQEIRPRYLFLDLFMPQMSGWDFLDKFNPLGEDSEVYILSGSLDKKDQEKANSNDKVKKFLSKLSVRESIPEIFRN